MIEEIWKEYKTFTQTPRGKIIIRSCVEISNYGNVRWNEESRWVCKPFVKELIHFNEKGRRVIGSVQIFHLVWELFNGPIPKGYCLHHIDEDKTNDCLDNLQLMLISDHIKMNKCTEETKRKISKAKSGVKTGPRSEETKRKISETLKQNYRNRNALS